MKKNVTTVEIISKPTRFARASASTTATSFSEGRAIAAENSNLMVLGNDVERTAVGIARWYEITHGQQQQRRAAPDCRLQRSRVVPRYRLFGATRRRSTAGLYHLVAAKVAA
jgi:hypothetical protein